MSEPSLIINPPVIAHRGASAYAPENTMPAFKKAKMLGASWVEFDVQLAGCGEVIVFHDATLERTTNGYGKVSDYPYAELKLLDAGSWFAPQFVNERIPTLKHVLDFLYQQGLSANIEIKDHPYRAGDIVKSCLAIVEEFKSKMVSPPLLSSFSLEILKELRYQSETCLIGFLMDEPFIDWQQSYSELRCSTLNVNQAFLDFQKVKTLKVLNQPMFAYTVNNPARAAELFFWGVDGVFTDCPDTILSR